MFSIHLLLFSHQVASDSATLLTGARQASLSITNSLNLLTLMPVESVMPSNHLIFCHPFSSCPQSFPASGSFPMSQFLTSGGQSIGVSASTSALPMNIQDWSPLGLTGLISLQSKGLSRVFSITTVWKHQFFGTQPFLQSNSHNSVIRIRLMASPTSQIRNPKIRNVGNHAQGHVTSMWMRLGV